MKKRTHPFPTWRNSTTNWLSSIGHLHRNSWYIRWSPQRCYNQDWMAFSWKHMDTPVTSPAIRNSIFIPGLSLGFYNMGPLSLLLWKCHLLAFQESWSRNKYGGTIKCRHEMLRICLSWPGLLGDPSEGSGGPHREFTMFFTSAILTIQDTRFVVWKMLRQK